MLEICHPSHLLSVEMEPGLEAEREQTIDLVASTELEAILEQNSRSLVVDGQVIACFGIWPMWPGVGRAWSMISPRAKRDYPCALFKNVKRNLETIIERDHLVRVEAVVASGHPSAHPWIRRLGFTREGLMRHYGIGGVGDYHLYSRIIWAHLN